MGMNLKSARTWLALCHLVAGLIFTAASGPAGAAMALGGNFWNIGWHKPGDCFVDWQKVQGDKPPLTLDETCELDCKAAGLKPGKYRFKAITMDGEQDLGPREVSGDAFKLQVKLESFEAAVYILAPLAGKGKGAGSMENR